jgi:hypothetical protein
VRANERTDCPPFGCLEPLQRDSPHSPQRRRMTSCACAQFRNGSMCPAMVTMTRPKLNRLGMRRRQWARAHLTIHRMLPAGLASDKLEQYLEAYYFPGLEIISAHEVWPGHFMQYLTRRAHPDWPLLRVAPEQEGPEIALARVKCRTLASVPNSMLFHCRYRVTGLPHKNSRRRRRSSSAAGFASGRSARIQS